MEITKSLRRILESIPGVTTIFLTDRDGVIVVSVGEELRSRPSLISSLQATQDQTGKLLIGHHISSVFFYESSQLVILNVPPLMAFIVASPTASTGSILKLREQLEPLLQYIESIVPDMPGGKFVLISNRFDEGLYRSN
ncbi:Mitogen-activated protein kinase kinase 1 interacting [Cooperia oncophora]